MNEKKQHPIDDKVRIGDQVKVIDCGRAYTTYDLFAETYGLTGYVSGTAPRHGLIGRVKLFAPHMGHGKMLYVVETGDGEQYLIERSGIIPFPYTNKFRFGQPVLAWNGIGAKATVKNKGRYIYEVEGSGVSPYPHRVYCPDFGVLPFQHVGYDPDGEPLIGDIVEVSDGALWKTKELAGINRNGDYPYIDSDGESWKCCRYPQTPPAPEIIVHQGRRYKLMEE